MGRGYSASENGRVAAGPRGRGSVCWLSGSRIPQWVWIVLVVVVLLGLAFWGYQFPRRASTRPPCPRRSRGSIRPARPSGIGWGCWSSRGFSPSGGICSHNWREEHAREHESERLREEVFQGYLDRMMVLMLDKSLIKSGHDWPVRDVARSLTLLALRRLDGERKGQPAGVPLRVGADQRQDDPQPEAPT